MPHRFEPLPQTVLEADVFITGLLIAWRDWLQARKELSEHMEDHAFHDRMAEKGVDLRLAFVAARRQFRVLQQSRHLRGGALRGRLGKLPLRDRCRAYADQWESLGKPKGWPGCPLASNHDGPHMDVLTPNT